MSQPANHRPSWKMLHRLGMIRYEQTEHRLVNPDQVMYAVRVDGELDLDRLAHAWDLVQRRHPVLGSSFDLANDEWRTRDVTTSALVVSRLPAEHRDVSSATTELGNALRIPFDLTRGPLARLHAVPADDARTLVGIAVDHIICDGWSAQVLFAELWHLYRDPQGELPPVRITFPELVAQEWAWLASEEGKGATQRCAEVLATVGPQPVAPLPGVRAGTASHERAHRAGFSLSAAEAARLRTVPVMRGLSPTALAHAALAGALHLLTDTEFVGTTLAMANRADRTVHRTQGWLADNVVVVTRAQDEVRKPAFLGTFAAAVAEALDLSSVPLAALIVRMAPEQFGLPSPHPTASVNSGAAIDRRFPLLAPPGATLTEVPVPDGWGYRSIVVRGAESAAGLDIRVSVKDRWFGPSTADLLALRMQELLTGWVEAS
jgi:hypothetical protein